MNSETIKAIINDPHIRKSIVELVYSEAYNEIQSLGGPGWHDENEINRGDALRALKKAKDKVLDKQKA